MGKHIVDHRDGVSLEGFITEHHALLSALGIFIALTIFAKELPGNIIGPGLSFILISGLVLIWLEVWCVLPERMSFRLFLFQYVLLWSGWGLVMYWLLDYRKIWHAVLFIPTAIAISLMIIWNFLPIIRHFTFTRNLFGIGNENKTKLQKFIIFVSLMTIIIFSLNAGTIISVVANFFLDLLKQTGI